MQQLLPQFLRQILDHAPLRLPDALESVYANAIAELKHEFRELDQCSYLLDDDSAESVACQLYKLFPTHCLKCLEALAIVELECVTQGAQTNVVGSPSVTLVDIGCGAGAASAALLALLQGYQEFLLDNGAAISPVQVLLVGLDPSRNMLRLYDRLIGEYAELLSQWLVRARFEKLAEPFPQGVWPLTRQLWPGNSHFVLLAMSNVVRPLGESFRVGRTPMLEKIWRGQRGEAPGDPGFGEAEATAIRSILEDWEVDRAGLLSITTSGSDRASIPWRKHLADMGQAIKGGVSPHAVTRRGVRARDVLFENPRGSWWRECGGQVGYRTRYYFDWLAFAHDSYVKDKQWHSLMERGKLELAWARARRYALHEVLPDEIELLLFDHQVKAKLDRLRRHVLARSWRPLGVENTLLFDVPKKEGETRPKTVPRLEEQTLGAAIIQSLGASADKYRTASYSYRLNDRSDEFLYKYWLHLWKRFLSDTGISAKSRSVLRSDVSRFYENIQQDTLVDIVKRRLGMSGRTEELLCALLLRDCGPRHATGRGLPQGHVASGFWADLYLAQVDRALSTVPGVTLARYADDMVFAIDENVASASDVKTRLGNALWDLGRLELSGDKTYTQSGGQYMSETTLDALLKELDEGRFKPLLTKVFRLNRGYRRLYARDPWRFVTKYRRLLGLISVHMSRPWLRRKLEQHSSPLVWLPWGKLQFPRFPESPGGEADWVERFAGLNARWTEDVQHLKRDLADLYRESIASLSTATATRFERVRATRRARFAAYRLCVLGLDEVAASLASEIAQRPFVVPVHALCRGLAQCGRGDLLVQILDTSGSDFVKACAIRALAETRPAPPQGAVERMWATLLQDNAPTCLKTKASEALLFADSWDTADIAQLQRLVEGESDPYLLKNYVLMMGRAFGDAVRCDLERLQDNTDHLIVIDAIQYALGMRGHSITDQDEPDVLLDYYSKDYPVAESDTKEDESP